MISVCIATYNGERYIGEQLESILSQIGDGDEVIISDDGSTDGTLEVVKSFKSPNIRICMNRGGHGYTPNFENAINKAKGDYIFLSDQDDVWLPCKVEKCMNYLKTCDFVVSDAQIVDANRNVLYDSFCAQRKSKFGIINNLIRFSFLGCCFAFRRVILDKALPFPDNHVLCTHDNWIAIVAMAYYKARFIPLQLIQYRRHEKNTSSGGTKAANSVFFMLHYRLYLLQNLLSRIRY